MRVLRSWITPPTFPVAIIPGYSSLHLFDSEMAFGGPGRGTHLFGAFDARPLKTFVELAEDAPQPVARGDVARGDLDRPLDRDFPVLELDLFEPPALLQDLGRPLEVFRAVLEGLVGHIGAEDRPFLEEQAVTGVGHHALVEFLDPVQLRLVELHVTHGRGPTDGGII